jgi:SAM-dependent methyltransferase
MKDLYKGRFLSEGYPALEKIGAEYYKDHQEPHPRVAETFQCLARLVDLSQGLRTVAVIGCGPNPRSIQELLRQGYDAVGVEAEYRSAQAAAEFLGDPKRVFHASVEALPLEDNSQRVVLLESVLEHVDSPNLSLSEAFRVLAPGGVLFIYTTNRLRFSLTGHTVESIKRFYNWFPAIVKECYVFHSLHYDPRLNNYSPRPAVHWFTYVELCKLGREAGFATFYSLLDLVEPGDRWVRGRSLKGRLIKLIKYRPWLKALALTQVGNAIFMLKRQE